MPAGSGDGVGLGLAASGEGVEPSAGEGLATGGESDGTAAALPEGNGDVAQPAPTTASSTRAVTARATPEMEPMSELLRHEGRRPWRTARVRAVVPEYGDG